MKHPLFFLALFIVATLLGSCSREDIQHNPVTVSKEITIQAVAPEEGPETRTIRLDNGNIWWTPGDQISVFYGSGSDGGSCFTAQIEENKRIANFTGTIGVITGGGDIAPEQTFFWGLYPYNSTAECDGSTLVTDIPDCQTAVPGTFAPGTYPWIGRSQGLLMSFYGLCGGIKFTVNKEGIKKATLKTADGSAIAGRVRIALDANSIPAVQEIIDGRDEIVLEAPDGEYFIPGKPYFFVTLPHNFDTSFFTVKFETFTEEGTYERKRALEIKRADFINFSSALDGKVTYKKKTGAIPVEDPAFKAYLVENFDTDGDGEISYQEAEEIRTISFSNNTGLEEESYVHSVQGIEYMPNLTELDCHSTPLLFGRDNMLHALDVTNNKVLKELDCYGNQLTELDLSNNTALTSLDCSSNQLTELNLLSNSALKEIDCIHNKLTRLDLSNNTALTSLNCWGNQLTELDLSNNTALTCLLCEGNKLTNLDLSDNTALTELYCEYNLLSELDLSNNTALTYLHCENNQLTELDISNNAALTILHCENNQLTELDLSNNTALTGLCCSGLQFSAIIWGDNVKSNLTWLEYTNSQLTELDLSDFTSLENLYCGSNRLTSLDLSYNPKLMILNCSDNQLTELDLSNNAALTQLWCEKNRLMELDLSALVNLNMLSCNDNFISTLNISQSPIVDLRCSPMNDTGGNNLLETLFIADGQTIPNVTVNRGEDHVPAETDIRIAPTTGGGEGSSETPNEP